MNLDYFDEKLTTELRSSTKLRVQEAYRLPDGRVVVLYADETIHDRGYLAISSNATITADSFLASTWEYEQLANASYALVQWEPTAQKEPPGHKRQVPAPTLKTVGNV